VTTFETLAALLTVAATFAYVNHRWFRQPAAIGLMAMSLATSLAFILLDRLGWHEVAIVAQAIVRRVKLDQTLLHGMLGVLLFAGALHIDVVDLREQRWPLVFLALGSTVVSTLLVGGLAHLVLGWLGVPLTVGYCFLFGALISPTDPIAVLGILKSAHVPQSMATQIAGESLFNDGVGVVIFITALGIVSPGVEVTAQHVVTLLVREAMGGVVFGLASGYLAYRLLRSIDHYQTELLITLALVLGGYALAERLGLSAPIAAVVAGLVIGNHGRAHGMSDVTREHLDTFWALVDEIMNAALFVLVGFELVRLSLAASAVIAGACMIPVVLLARLASVAGPVALLSRTGRFASGSIAVLTWGGLRGGISVALALSTTAGPEHDLIVTMTYLVVVFSIFVQGLTLAPLARRIGRPAR
jgi:CPA1 family monovalent cation:H+ antiporter